MDPRSLVCNKCWDQLFNTQEWEDYCRGVERGGASKSVTHSVSSQGIRRSAADGCTFCSLLWTYLQDTEDSTTQDILCKVELDAYHFAMTTPRKNNARYLTFGSADTKSHKGIGSSAQSLSVFTTANDVAAKYISARPLEKHVFSAAAQEQMRTWIHECSDHDCCPPQIDMDLPTRVIDVRPEDNPDSARLILTKGAKGQYATLSYCWGDHAQTQLKSSNMAQYFKNLDTSQLSQAIQDAIAVARAIHVRYLWIDALCILQDSEEDKRLEIANMERIYRNALVAIVAASSTSASEGFLEPRERQMHARYPCGVATERESWPVPFRESEKSFGTMHIQCLECQTEYDEGNEPINKRAWTLQEQLLPNRLMIFSSHTLQWRCNPSLGTRNLGNSNHFEHNGNQEDGATSLRELGRVMQNPGDALMRWLKITDLYSTRASSLHSDKLPALAAIAKHYSHFLGTYYAGIWSFNLLWQLRWSISGSEEHEAKSVQFYRAPSWSWASLDGQVFTDYDPDEPAKFYEQQKVQCELIQVITNLKDPLHPYGEVTGGCIVVRGIIRQGWLIPSPHSLKGPKTVILSTEEDPSLASAQAKYDAWASQKEFLQTETYDDGSTSQWIDGPTPWMSAQLDLKLDSPQTLVTCLPLFEDFGLLLQSTDDGNYRRVGSFVRFDWVDDFVNFPTSEVKII